MEVKLESCADKDAVLPYKYHLILLNQLANKSSQCDTVDEMIFNSTNKNAVYGSFVICRIPCYTLLLLILSDPLKFQDMREEDGRLSVPLWDSDFMPWGKSNQEFRVHERRIFSAIMMHGSRTLGHHVWQRCLYICHIFVVA